MNQTLNLSNIEKLAVALFLTLKLALLLSLPLTGDEAYFISWAQQPAPGYYDHPPAVGWVIYLLSFISEHYYFYRFFAFVSTMLVAWLIYRLIQATHDNQTAMLVALVFLVSPLSLFAVILVNDIVLLLFGLLGFYFVVRSLDSGTVRYAIIAGLFLGLTFLSKYLSVPLFIGILLYLLFNARRQDWKLALVAMTIVGLFVAENLYFNLHNCWNNLLFNLVSRTRGSDFNLGYLALYFVILAFAVPPQGVCRLLKSLSVKIPATVKLAICISASFLVVFLAVSSFKRIGLHWLYLPVTFIYLAFCLLPVERLRGLLKYNAAFSILLAMALLVLILQFDRLFADNNSYRDALVYTQPYSICAVLPPGETIMTLSYSQNSVLAYHCQNNNFHVFANTSKYGREDDKRVDYQDYGGTSLYLLIPELSDLKKIRPYFESTKVILVPMTDTIDYYLIKGKGFKFESYRPVIEKINNRYYNPPAWLPSASCEFAQKYSL